MALPVSTRARETKSETPREPSHVALQGGDQGRQARFERSVQALGATSLEAKKYAISFFALSSESEP